MYKILNKFAMVLANFSILVNTFLTPITVYAQDSTPTETSTEVTETTPQPAEETQTPPAENTPAPTTEPTPEVTVEPTVSEEVTPTSVPEETVTPSPSEESTEIPEGEVEGTNTETPVEETPDVEATTNEENAHVSAVVVENVEAASVTEEDVVYDGTGTPQLATDKADYAPTDVVLISGTGFEANKEYDLVITGTGEFRFDDKVKSDESGGLFYTYQLDGTYRPDYKVEILDNDEVVSSMTFTDSDTGFKNPTANVQNGSGDDWDNPANAYSNGSGYASEQNEESHRYYNYGFGVPGGASIDGIEVLVDTWSEDNTGCRLKVDLSWNGGSNWSSSKTQNLTSSEATYTLGGSTDDWGSHTWVSGDFSDANFRSRVEDDRTGSCGGNPRLDWIRIKVYYTLQATATPTLTPTPTATPTPTPILVANPTLPQACGLDLALVIDTSTSIDDAELGQMKTAFKTFVNAFVGTPTQVAVVSFDDSAVVQSGFTANLATLTDPSGVIDDTDGSGFTNWEDAIHDTRLLFTNRADKPDLIVFTSDGNPTVSDGPLSDLQDAVTEANTAKGSGIRIVTLGIGGELSQANLEAISSADAYYSSANFDDLTTTLEQLVTDLCGGTVNITKKVDGVVASGWTFTPSVTDGTVDPTSGVTDINGQVSFEVDPTDTTSTVDVAETVQPGYLLSSVSCTKNNQSIQPLFDADSVNGLSVGENDIVSCTFENITAPYCGDGIVNPETEDCDGQAGVPEHYTCTDTCNLQYVPYCGDGVLNQTSEQCDDGNADNTDACTNSCIINTGTLIVKKVVVGSNDLPSLFSFQVDGGPVVSFEADGQNDLTVNVESYTVTEPAVLGYTTTYDNCEKVNVSYAETETCTITNTKDTGSVKVNKRADANGDGDWNDTGEGVNGTASNAFNWNIDTVGTNAMGSTVSGVVTGSHAVNENSVAGYHFTGWFLTSDTSKTCANTTNTLPANVTVVKGQTTEITLCNQRDKGTIVIVKEAVPTSEDNFSFDTVSGFPGGDFELEDDGNDNNGGTEESKTISVATGQYWVKEDGETGWGLTDLVCNDGQSQVPSTVNLNDRKATINVEKDETVTCTFTNKKLAKLIIKKETNPNNSNKEFDFTRSFGSGFDLEDGDSRTFENLVPGDYTVTEVGETGWVLGSVVCSDQTQANGNSVTVNLDYNETVTCTFNNVELGKVEGYKFNDKNGDGGWDLGENKLNGWKIFIDENNNGTYDDGEPSDTTNGQFWFFGWYDSGEYGFDNLEAGTYKICEELQNGWTNSTPVCQETTLTAGDEDSVNFGNHQPLTLGAYKVVCETEAYLPNWGDDDAPNITSSTAQNFVDDTNEKAGSKVCWLQEGWNFQYGLNGKVTKYGNGNQLGVAPEPWQTLGTTDASGYAEVTVSDLEDADGIWVREELKEDYVPFSYPPAGPTNEPYSAEIYCHRDGDHYDNFDQVSDPEFGETYYCVAFNALNNGDLQVCKYDDYDGDGKKDEGEPGIPGVNMTLNKVEENLRVELDQTPEVEGLSDVTGENGCVTFEDLDLGEYEVTESLEGFPGYTPTAEYEEGTSDENADGQIQVTVNPGETTLVEFLNKLNPVTITLEKAADEEATGPGDIIFYTLKVKNTSDHTAYDAQVADFTPFGFVYQTGTTEVDDAPSSDPSISGPVLTWNLGTIDPGQEIKVEYQMKAPDPLNEGTFTNIALATAYNRPSEIEVSEEASLLDFLVSEVSALTPNPLATRTESLVAIDVVRYSRAVSFSSNVGGQVLGASTVLGAVLPATGSETYILYALLSTLALGLWFKYLSTKQGSKK